MTKHPSSLVTQGLGRCPGGAVWLWRDLSFSVGAGESLAVTGPSGTGKTLLLRALAGLDPLDEGAILLDGKPIEDWNPPLYRSQVSYLQQRPAFLPGSVEANLRQPFELAVHRGKHFDRERASALLRELGRAPSLLEQDAALLSGGEAQIVALMRVLQLAPRFLLLDEPTSSLDPETTARVEAILRSWKAEDPERALVWTSHDAAQLKRVADRELSLARRP